MMEKEGTINIGVFEVKYSIKSEETGFENRLLYDLIVLDILVGNISIKKDLNYNFNTYKSMFAERLVMTVEEKEPQTKFFLSINDGLSGYYD